MQKDTFRWAAAVTAAAALAARSEYEKKHFQIVSYDIKTDRLGAEWNEKRMVFLSDLHDNCFGKRNSQLKEAIRMSEPSAVLIGGDMMIAKPWKRLDFDALEDLLSWLSDLCPVYYANGNHESRILRERAAYPGWAEAFVSLIERTGVRYLSDSAACICEGESRMYIYGLDLDEVYYKKGNRGHPDEEYLEGKLGRAKRDGFCLLMAHNPLYLREYAEWGADLVLAGHFHGGTIRLPFIGGLMSPQLQFFSRYSGDTVTRDGTPMIVSAGLGTHSVNVRLNNPAQLVVLNFKTDNNGLQE